MENRTIFCCNPISEAGLVRFAPNYSMVPSLEEADALLVRSADLNSTEFPRRIRAIARAGAGVNNIPLDRCAEQGIVVFNTPGANANGVKELTIAGLLLASRDIIGGAQWVKEHKDDPAVAKDAEKAKKAFAGIEIQGKTLGVIGLGAIGVLVANAALDLGMKVIGYDPFLSVSSAWKLSGHVRPAVSLDELYADSDYITIHVPATASTRGMVDASAFAKMKEGARLLNFARDSLVDEAALSEALTSGKLACYVTDFATPGVLHLDHVIALPHLGASTEESEENCAVMAVDQLQDYIDNGNITHSVNYPDLNAGVCQTASRVAILHRNIPNMLRQFTGFFGDLNHNIETLQNKAKGDYAYTVMDLSYPLPENTVRELKAIDGVLRVRVLKGKETVGKED
ncbi:MAG: phosphoglycerate dehydrogenase [Oscillospiraceae bacterium]|nr:phosphoglycerate dehydrogenase [Oscillospiraceae bacterium]